MSHNCGANNNVPFLSNYYSKNEAKKKTIIILCTAASVLHVLVELE